MLAYMHECLVGGHILKRSIYTVHIYRAVRHTWNAQTYIKQIVQTFFYI